MGGQWGGSCVPQQNNNFTAEGNCKISVLGLVCRLYIYMYICKYNHLGAPASLAVLPSSGALTLRFPFSFNCLK